MRADRRGGDVIFHSLVYRHNGCSLLSQKCRGGWPVGQGSTMGYSGPTGPMPVLTCLPEDWWDPAWQAMQSPGVTVPERGIVAAPEAGAAEPEAHADEAPPSWRQVAGTTFGLWTARHLPWLCRRSGRSRRLVAVAALGAGLLAVGVGTAGLATSALSPVHAAPLPARPAPIPAPTGRTVAAGLADGGPASGPADLAEHPVARDPDQADPPRRQLRRHAPGAGEHHGGGLVHRRARGRARSAPPSSPGTSTPAPGRGSSSGCAPCTGATASTWGAPTGRWRSSP